MNKNIYNRKSVVRLGTVMGQTVSCDAKVCGINMEWQRVKSSESFLLSGSM